MTTTTQIKTVIEYDSASVLAKGCPQATVFGKSLVRFKHLDSINISLDIRGDDAPQLMKRLRAFESVVRDTIIYLEDKR
jgi:hypothetical protein